MTEKVQPKRIRIGAKMRQAWDYVNKHPGELAYVIKIQFGNHGGRILDRMVAAKMIRIEDNRVYPVNNTDADWDRRVAQAQNASQYDPVRLAAYEVALQVPCTNRDCLAPAQTPCTGLNRWGRPRVGPHYERLVVATYCLQTEINNIARP
jgi:hypothetical protein